MAIRFANRQQAGELLATKLATYADRPDVLVLALPRGGVPVGFALARTLHVALDIFLVRKLGVPGHEELAMGAIASGGVRVLNTEVVQLLHIPDDLIDLVAAQEQREIDRREHLYRAGRPLPHIRGRTVILVDDGLATGATMRAAVAAVRHHQPARLVVAVPTAAPETCAELQAEADEVVCATTPEPFYAVGLWYADFTQVTDMEVRDLLAQAARLPYAAASTPEEPARAAR
jgi:putative phosphoribosyl transferase